MELFLDGKVAFISGGTRGIGLAIVRAFLDEGAKVAFIARDKKQVDSVIGELQKKFSIQNIIGYAADATNEEQLIAAFNQVKSLWGDIDILISNVGDGRSVPDPMPDKDNFQKVWNTNFGTAENLVRLGLGFLKPKDSQILFISSITGIEALGAPTDYSVAKSAVIALSKNLARKLAPNIRVNCIAPGNVFFDGGNWDDKMKDNPDSVNQIIQTTVPMKRFGKPEEIADSVLFLCSARAGFITGTCLIVDGGQTLSLH